MNMIFSGDSFHILGKPAEVLRVLASLAESYDTLGDLLASWQSITSLHLEPKLPCEDTGSTRSEEEFRVFLDCPSHGCDINCVSLKPSDRRYPVFGDNNMAAGQVPGLKLSPH